MEDREFETAVRVYAHYLGMHGEDEESRLLYLAWHALTRLPPGWELGIAEGENAGIPYYYNCATEQSVWVHPEDRVWIARVRNSRVETAPRTESMTTNAEKQV